MNTDSRIDTCALPEPERIVEQLRARFGGRIIRLPEDQPTEIICELGPEAGAVAVIGRSAIHYHRHTTETYEILEGRVEVYIENVRHVMGTGDGELRTLVIEPGKVHWARGGGMVKVTCQPPWTPQDHILV